MADTPPAGSPGITQTDPNGLAALVVSFATTILTAVDPSGIIGARWIGTVTGAVAIVALLWARRKAWSPAAVWLAATQARKEGHAIAVGLRRPLTAPGHDHPEADPPDMPPASPAP